MACRMIPGYKEAAMKYRSLSPARALALCLAAAPLALGAQAAADPGSANGYIALRPAGT